MNALAALAAALVRRSHVDCFDELMRHIGRQLFQSRILLNTLNEQISILVLLFLYFDLLPENLCRFLQAFSDQIRKKVHRLLYHSLCTDVR